MRTKLENRKAVVFVLSAVMMAALVVGAAGAQSASSETILISRADGVDGDAGNGTSFNFSRTVSDDGRYVAFTSASDNLHPDDTDATNDVFVRDTQTGATILVSRATGADGEKGNNSSNVPSISDDGRFVAFRSAATNLDPADAASTVSNDVYVRDLQNNTTTLVSRANGFSGVKANGANSDNPSISGDGRFVAFSSDATNLPGDSDATTDVFVRDLSSGTTTLASRAEESGGEKGNDESRIPSISDDGLRVAFQSIATNLHPDDTDATNDIFVRDLSTSETILASRANGPDGAKGDGGSFDPSLSGDGFHVSFTSDGTNLHDDDDDIFFDAFARDLSNDATTLASRRSGANGAAASGGSFGVSLTSISDDGRFVAFDTDDTNLPGDTDAIFDVFVRDTQEDTTILASRASGASGAKGNSESFNPSLSGDGRHVAFQSSADNLHPDDTDTVFDVFLRALDAPPDTPLDTTITAGPDDTTNENRPTFEFTSNKTGSTFECRLDSTDEADFDPCRSPFRTGRLADGEHTFEVRAIGRANTPDDSPATRAFTVDAPDPRGCTTTGTSGNDRNLRGTSGDDVICGLGGNDRIYGLGGGDTIHGDGGRDTMLGASGSDTLFGGENNDTLTGNAGSDEHFGEGGADTLSARDRVRGNDTADGGGGTDRCATDIGDTRVSCP